MLLQWTICYAADQHKAHMDTAEERIATDVLIVGAGPAGLACAVRLKQLATQHNTALNVIVLEKAANVGDHILSGCVFNPIALNTLFPDWQNRQAPLTTQATSDNFCWLTQNYSFPLPVPPSMQNDGNYIISLSQLTRWLASEAEKLGVEIYCGFAGSEARFDDTNTVIGITTNAQGLNKKGEAKSTYQPAMAIDAKITVLAEGARGSLSEQLIAHYHLRKDCSPQTYGIGLKELWEVPHSSPGKIIHTVGWPLPHNTYGGGFLYHLPNNQVYVGLVVGLDYQNPYLDPYAEFQRYKTHPAIKPILTGGKPLQYGARALNEGGWQSIPQLHFPGGVLVGCAAGFLDVPQIKGSHMAMQSGMFAAESIMRTLQKKGDLNYRPLIDNSWVGTALKRARNVRPAFRFGLIPGLLYAGLDYWLLKGGVPWTFTHKPDHLALLPVAKSKPIFYPKPDNIFTFDKMTSVSRSNTYHEEDQPCHLRLTDPGLAVSYNLPHFAAPETRYCPAGVYEIITLEGEPRLQINAQNCIHCKTCDIKDPKQNIRWTPPEGGGGPSYQGL